MIILSETVVFFWAMFSFVTLILCLIAHMHSNDKLTFMGFVFMISLAFTFPAGLIMVAAYFWEVASK